MRTETFFCDCISFSCVLYLHINHAMPLFTLLLSGKLVTYATICGIYKCTSPQANASTRVGNGHSNRSGA